MELIDLDTNKNIRSKQDHEIKKEEIENCFDFRKEKENLILILSGSFYPIHNNHIRTLQVVKNYFESDEMCYRYNIAGGLIVPTHNSNLESKLKIKVLPARERLKMLSLVLESNDDLKWIRIYQDLLLARSNYGLGKVTDKLRSFFGDNFSEYTVTVATVMGFDYFTLVERKLNKGTWVFVQNRPNLSNLNEIEILESILKINQNIHTIYDKSIPYEISSTEIRNLLKNNEYSQAEKFLDATVLKYLTEKSDYFRKYENNIPKVKIEELVDKNKIEYNIISFEELKKIDSNSENILGKGLQAKVYEYHYDKLGIKVAVKVFDLSSQRGRRIKTFVREVTSLCKINHPNIIRIFGVGSGVDKNSDQQFIFYVMERAQITSIWKFLEGERKEWLKNPSLFRKWVKAFADLAEGCQAMANAGVYHRDLQLDNILITSFDEQSVEIKLSDFGVSAEDHDKALITRGSLRHYAPESIEDKRVYTSASDVFSFGLLLIEFINKKRIWASLTVNQVIEKIKKGEKPTLKIKVEIPSELVGLIHSCLDLDPEKRPDFKTISLVLNEIYTKLG